MSLGSILLSLLGCSTTQKIAEGNQVSGPFEIRWIVEKSRSTSWFNNGSHAPNYTSYFSVYHRGKLVELPMDMDDDKEKRQYFWQALFLSGSDNPAVLVGVHSMYLLTEQDGQLQVSPLDKKTDWFATYQWLDSEQGQPGPPRKVNLGDNSRQSRFLTGGRYLLVNERVVLDVKEGKAYPFNIWDYEQMQALGGYNAGNSSTIEVSPSGQQLVFCGSRQNENELALFQEYALVVIDYKTNRMYGVPFDKTETHFYSSWEATSDWVKTYFEWTKDKEGRDLLRKRVLKNPPPWQGQYRYDTFNEQQLNEYQVRPVKFSMMETMVRFLQAHYQVTDVQRQERQYGTTQFRLTVNGTLIYLSYLHELQSAGEDQCVTVHGGQEGSSPLLQSIGKEFDAAMRAGQYQQEYTEFKDWTLKRN